MPIISSESLDDQLLTAGALSFSGGMDSSSDPTALRPDQLSEIVNMDIDRNGFITTRTATSNMMHTIAFSGGIQFLTNYTDGLGVPWLLLGRSGGIYRYDGYISGSSSTFLATSPNLIQFFSFTTHFPSSTARQIQTALIGSTLFISEGTPSSPLRFFHYSGAGATNTSNGDAGNGTRYNVRNTAGNYTDTAVFPLNAGFFLLAAQAGRVWGVRTSQPDRLYYSKLLPTFDTADSWDAAANIQVGSDGLPITAISAWTGTRLVVFKQNSTYILDANPLDVPANTSLALTGAYWSLEKVTGEVGCVAQRSIAQVGSNLYWLAADGVRTMTRTLAGQETEVSEPISKPIASEISKMNPTEASFAAGAYFKNRYFLSFATGAADRNTTTIVYNVINQAWCGKWTNGFMADAFAIYKPRKAGRGQMLYLAQNYLNGQGTTAGNRLCSLSRWVDDPSNFSGNAYADHEINTDYRWWFEGAARTTGLQYYGAIYAYNLTPQQGSSLATISTFYPQLDENGNYLHHQDGANNRIRIQNGSTQNPNYFEIYDNSIGRVVYRNTAHTSGLSGFYAVDQSGDAIANIGPPLLVGSSERFQKGLYASSFKTKEFDFDTPLSPKTLNNIDILFGSSEANASALISDMDGGERYAFTNQPTSSAGSGSFYPVLGKDSQTVGGETFIGIFLPFYLYKPTAKKISRSALTSSGSRAYSVKVEASGGKLDVRKLIMTAFEDTFVPEGA